MDKLQIRNRIVDAIRADLNDRRGMNLDGLEEDALHEILSSWSEKIDKILAYIITGKSPVQRQDFPYEQKRKWKYTEDDTLGGECYDCGIDYGGAEWTDVALPDEIWELINPTDREGGGILCFNCIVRRLKFLGLENVPYYIGSGPLCDYTVDGKVVRTWDVEKRG